MLTGIKKLLTTLGALCVILIVVEELSHHIPASDHRREPKLWTSRPQPLAHTPVNNATTPLKNEASNFQVISDSIEVVQLLQEPDREVENSASVISTKTRRRQNTVSFTAQEAGGGAKKGGIPFPDYREDISDDDIQSPSDVREIDDGIDVPDDVSNMLDDANANPDDVDADLDDANADLDDVNADLDGVDDDLDDVNADLDDVDADMLDDVNDGLDDDEERRLRLSPYIYHEDEEKKRLSVPPVQTSYKLISYFLPWDLDRHQEKGFRRCHYYKCSYINNMSQADAILFRASHIRDHIIPEFYRPKGQRWILFTSDPSIKGYALDRPDVGSQFNWTMTYQLDADYSTIFGMLRRREPPPRDFEAVYARKDRQVAWFVSHCPTWGRRERYVERMSKILQVDVFGKCGNLTCGPIHYRGNDSTECLPMLTNHYKFYLAFENSFCKDYVSEKFFKLFQNVDVVPVVRGGFNYKRYMPSGIFVDASDFKNPEDLSHYLIRLGNDRTRYIGMLRRKSEWIHISTIPFQCKVCQALHTAESRPKHYSNLKAKFNGEPSNCWPPTDLGQVQT